MTSLGLAVLLGAGCLLSACQKPTPDEPARTESPRATPAPASAPPTASALPTATAPPTPPTTKVNPVAAAAPAAADTPKKRYVVAALGDSITDARGGGGGYLEVLRRHCPKSRFLNFGKGGNMTNQMRRRWESDIRPNIAAEGITTLLVYGGVNDLYSDLTAGRKNDRIEADLTAIYQSARASGLEVIAVTVSPWGGFSKYWNPRRGENTRLLNSWIMGQVATGLVDKAVDSFAPLSCGNADSLCPDYETRFHDGIHPGKVGHEILGQKLAEEALADCL